MTDITHHSDILHGPILTDDLQQQQQDIISTPQTTYLCGMTKPTNLYTNFETYILPSFKSTNLNGLYKLQIKIQIQNESCVNHSVKNLISLSHNFEQIDPYPIAVNSDSPAIYCTGFGYLK